MVINEKTILFSVKDEKLILKIPKCIFAPVKNLEIREWTNFCFFLSNSSKIYARGWADYSHTCDNSEIDAEGIKEISIKIGETKNGWTPFSGKLADIKFYWRSLSGIELWNISKVRTYPSDYEQIPIQNNSRSKDVDVTKRRTFVTISSITDKELLSDPPEYVVIYINEEVNYEYAFGVCQKKRSSLPDLKLHGRELIKELLLEFSWRAGVTIEGFWSTSDQSTCYSSYHYGTLIEYSSGMCDSLQLKFLCFSKTKRPLKMIGLLDKAVEIYPVPFQVEYLNQITTIVCIKKITSFS